MATIGEIYPQDAERTADEQINSLKDRSREFAQKAREKTQALAEDAMEMVKNHPAQTIGIAVGVGALVGAVIALALKPEESPSQRLSGVGNEAWQHLKTGLEDASCALRESVQKALKTIK